MFKWIVRHILRPEWVVVDDPSFEDSPELMLCIWGVCIGLYKSRPIFYTGYKFRRPGKREFGESLHPAKQAVPSLSSMGITKINGYGEVTDEA